MGRTEKGFAMIFILTLIFTLASCTGKTDGVTYSNAGGGETYSFTFLDDSSFFMHYHMEQNKGWDSLLSDENLSSPVTFTIVYDYDVISGTYEGRPGKDGELRMNVKKRISIPEDSQMGSKITNALMAGNSTMSVTNDDYPLVPSSGEEGINGTVKGKILSIGNLKFKKSSAIPR